MSQHVSLTLAEMIGIRNLYRAAWPSVSKTIGKLNRAIEREQAAKAPDTADAGE